MTDAGQKPFPLLSLEEALEQVLCLAAPLPSESADLDDALGRALTADVLATRTLPPFDNSAMDGYAVRSADTAPGARLRVTETVYAGHLPVRALGPGECARIMTGAPLPTGADAVVMQEQTHRTNDEIHLDVAAPPGQFVRPRGEDATLGQPLLLRGTALGVAEAGLLWAQGLTRVDVPRRPRVALLSTGDELAAPGAPLPSPAHIIDTNGPSLAALVRRAGGIATFLGIAPDALAPLSEKVSEGLAHDVLITSAGVSVGEHDWVKTALEQQGVSLRFWKVAIKPGKPLVVGQRGRTTVFGLPGNPASSMVTFELFVRPFLLRLLGRTDVTPPKLTARLAKPLRKAAGLTHFVRVTAREEGGTWVAYPLGTQTSGALRSVASATHLLQIPADTTDLAAGTPVEIWPVSWAP